METPAALLIITVMCIEIVCKLKCYTVKNRSFNCLPERCTSLTVFKWGKYLYWDMNDWDLKREKNTESAYDCFYSWFMVHWFYLHNHGEFVSSRWDAFNAFVTLHTHTQNDTNVSLPLMHCTRYFANNFLYCIAMNTNWINQL